MIKTGFPIGVGNDPVIRQGIAAEEGLRLF